MVLKVNSVFNLPSGINVNGFYVTINSIVIKRESGHYKGAAEIHYYTTQEASEDDNIGPFHIDYETIMDLDISQNICDLFCEKLKLKYPNYDQN